MTSISAQLLRLLAGVAFCDYLLEITHSHARAHVHPLTHSLTLILLKRNPQASAPMTQSDWSVSHSTTTHIPSVATKDHLRDLVGKIQIGSHLSPDHVSAIAGRSATLGSSAHPPLLQPPLHPAARAVFQGNTLSLHMALFSGFSVPQGLMGISEMWP